MRATFEFVLEYVKKSANRQIRSSQFLRYVYNLVFRSFQKVQIYEICGLSENSNDKMMALFVGEEHSARQFASLVYHQIDRTQLVGELRFSQIVSTLAINAPDIIAVDVERPSAREFEKQGYLLLPQVSFSLDLHRSIDDIVRKMSRRRRRDLKKIEALNYSYAISKGKDEDFDFFYWKMYSPYAAQRFGKAAYIKGYNEAKAFYKTGGRIVFVRNGQKLIAGILFRTIGKTLYAISMGLSQSEKHAEQLGSQAALLFLIKWAKMNGMDSLDYGTSLPFFREGVFTYKKEWGMSVTEPINRSYYALKLNSLNAGSLSFLQQNPFIISDNETLKGVILLNHKPTKEELQQVFSEYFLPKLSSIIFIAYYKSNAEPLDKGESTTKSIGSPQVLTKPLLSICLLLQKETFKVEALEVVA